ncbi:MAG: GDP-mannose 4,6-dehydratase [Candidatus Sumerlaeia bacterium]|nr:GDP-mannose 4,6-dehydratase [Candidatus Sumerlaeia bacterium]
MKALVTGAAGFIGSKLCGELLARGWEVAGLDAFTDYYARALKERNLAPLRGRPGFAFHEAWLAEADWAALLDGVSVVFHQAAQAGVRASWGRDFRLYTDWNVLGTQVLLEAARHQPKPPRIVYASSSSVYGERDTFPFYETDRPEPLSPYGVTKLAAEHLCVLYTRNFGLETASLRYFTVYGPGQRPDMAFHKFLRAAFTGGRIPLYGDGEQTRDFTFIADAVEANIAAALHGRPGGVYNIGGGSRVTVNEVLATLARVAEVELNIERLPRQPGDVSHTVADTAAARGELHWEPKVKLEEGLRAEAEYIRQLLAEGL